MSEDQRSVDSSAVISVIDLVICLENSNVVEASFVCSSESEAQG